MPLAARILVLALALTAATCGQKGPLTPPGNAGLTPAPAAGEGSAAKRKAANAAVFEAARSA